MHTNMVCYRAPNKTIPEQFLDICSGEKSDYVGASLAYNGLLRTVKLDGEELQAVKDTCNLPDYAAANLMLTFGNDENDVDIPEQCQQPFIPLLGSDNAAQCACYVVGDYIGYDTTNTTNTVEFLVHQEVIVNYLKDLFSSVGEDEDKLISKLREPRVQRGLLGEANAGDNAMIIFHFPNGEFVIINKGFAGFTNFTWGWATQRFGWDQDMLTGGSLPVSTAAPSVEPPKIKDMFGAAPSAPKPPAAVPAVPTVTAAPKPPVAAVPPVVPGTGPQPVIPPAKSADTTVLIYWPEDKLRSGKAKKHWLAQYVGHNPPDWKESKPGPWPLKSAYHSSIKALVDSGKIILAGQPAAPSVAAPAKPAPVEAPKDIPIILSADDKQRASNIFTPILLGTIDQVNTYIDDPDKIRDMIQKTPSFLKQMGWPDEAMLKKGLPSDLGFYDNWQKASWEQLIRLKIDWAIRVIQDFQIERWQLMKALSEAAKIKAA